MGVLIRQVVGRLRSDRRALLAVAIAFIANAVILAAYIWSRGGQSTTVSFAIEGETASVAVDGRLQSFALDLEGVPLQGGIILTLSDTGALPSLPNPRGVARVEVLDFAGENTLFEDDFSDGLDPAWEVTGGAIIGDGVIGSTGNAQLALKIEQWRDVRVNVVYKNVQSASIGLRARDDGYAVFATVRPFHWNQDATGWINIAPGRPGVEAPGIGIELDRSQSMKSLLAMLTRPYPYALLLGLIAVLLTAILTFFPTGNASDRIRPLQRIPPWVIAVAFAEVVFIILLYFNFSSREHMPYVPDSVAYLFQAKIFASGNLTTDPPRVQGAFDFFIPAPFVLTEDSWGAQFPFFHPFSLAIGQLFGAPWLMPPLFGAASAALIYVVGRRVYNGRVALLAAVLLATSPFFIMQASNLMSHNTAGFLLLACLAALTYRDKRPLLSGVLAGLAFGLFLNTRPLTALALALPFAVFLLAGLLPPKTRRQSVIHVGAFFVAGAAMALLFLGWNYALTGDAFTTGYQSTGVTFFDRASPEAPAVGPDRGAVSSVGTGGSHDSAVGVQNERMQLALLLLVLHGWPAFVGLIFSLLPFLLGSRNPQDWFFLACATAATAIWVLYESSGVMYGPRYWFEALPFLILLAARGADRAADLIASLVAAGRDGDLDAAHRPYWAARTVVFGVIGLLVLGSVYGWLLGQRTSWQADLVPNRASAMCCALGVDDRIHRLADEQDLHDALVLVDPCGNNFVCYGSVFWRNSADLDGDIVYARDITTKRAEIIAAYPGRTVYLATYQREGSDEATLRPYFP